MQPEWGNYPLDPSYMISDYGDVFCLRKRELVIPYCKGITQQRLAEEYGVDQGTISNIVNFKSYKEE